MASSSSRIQVQTRIVLQAALDGDLRILKKMAEQMDLGLAEDEEGANPLYLAAHGGCLECCKFLVEKVRIDVNSTTTKGTTPLVCALFSGNLEVMKYLLDRGANPKRKTLEGKTLLHAAAARGQCEPLKLLLSQGNPADIMLEEHGGTPLHAAASREQDEAMKILLEHGADPNRLMGHNISALMLACYHKSFKCMKLLIEAGADVNDGSYCGPTTLTQAVKNGSIDVVKFLLEAGADPNDPGEDGEIAIQLAGKRGDRDLVKVLFSKTNPVPSLPYWSVDGIIRMMESPRIRRQDAVPVGARVTDLKSRAKQAFAKKDYHAALYFFGRHFPLGVVLSGPAAVSPGALFIKRGESLFRELVMEINPFDATMFSNRSLCWLRMREGESALSDAQRCRQLMPGWCKGWFLEDYQRAADAFMETLKLDPESDEIKKALGKTNNVVHGDGKASVTASVPFLQNYVESTSGTQHGSLDIKGKAAVYAILEPSLPDADGSMNWEPPPIGWIKANVDASWDAQTERGGVGVVIRDQTGSVRSFIPTCASAEAAEIIACVEGLRHLGDFTQWPAILESDAAQVISTLSAYGDDRSANWGLYMEARGLMASLPEVKLSKVNHQGNKVAYCLAQLAKGELYGVLRKSNSTTL